MTIMPEEEVERLSYKNYELGIITGYKEVAFIIQEKIVEACKKSPRAECLLLRVIEFNNNLEEVHGFKVLGNIDVNDYTEPITDGMTALFDATYSSIGAILTYAKKLVEQDYGVNGICFIITDGDDNVSSITPSVIADTIKQAKIGEEIESLISVLIGINTTDCKNELEDFRIDANLNQYVDVGEASADKLARLAAFVSKSISSQSQALGSGGPSQPLTF